MPILFFVLLVVLIAYVGFWDTFAAVLGAMAMIVLLVVLAAAVVGLGVYVLLRPRSRRT